MRPRCVARGFARQSNSTGCLGNCDDERFRFNSVGEWKGDINWDKKRRISIAYTRSNLSMLRIFCFVYSPLIKDRHVFAGPLIISNVRERSSNNELFPGRLRSTSEGDTKEWEKSLSPTRPGNVIVFIAVMKCPLGRQQTDEGPWVKVTGE